MTTDHYDKIFQIAETLKSKHVPKKDIDFDRLFCAQIVWAYIEDQRNLFSDPLQPNDLRKGKKVRYPKSLLDLIAGNIRFQEKEYYRGNFPWQWRHGLTGLAAIQPASKSPTITWVTTT